jgi:hypothetical protein
MSTVAKTPLANATAQTPVTYNPENFVLGVSNVIKADAQAGLSFVQGVVKQIKACQLPALSPARYDAELSPVFKKLIADKTGLSEQSARIYQAVIKPMVIALTNGFVLPDDARSKNAAAKACVAFIRTKGWGTTHGRKARQPGAGGAGGAAGPNGAGGDDNDAEPVTLQDIADLLFGDNPAARNAFVLLAKKPEALGKLLIDEAAKQAPVAKPSVTPRRYKMLTA